MLEREWRLQAKVVQQWRCHPERMRAIAAFDHESSVVTAGRGLVSGKQAEVLRCWRISTGTAGTFCDRTLATMLYWQKAHLMSMTP